MARYGRISKVIYPPVDTARFRHLDRDPHGFLLTLGELVPYKRFDLAVLAAAATRRSLVVVGDGPERARLKRLASGADVRFVGRVTDRQLLDLMSGAAALLHPGVEDFGIVIVEALAAGLPVIGAPTGGAAEILTEGTGLLAHALEVSAFAEAIESVLRIRVASCDLRERAEHFGVARFRTGLADFVAGAAF